MTDTEALLQASVRERRRLSAMFILLLIIVAGTLGTAWLVERGRGDSWRDQAVYWQEWGVELYDEFTAATGKEPDAPDPSAVAQDAPEAVPGEPGPAGVAGVPGARGPGPSAQQVLDGIAQCFAEGSCTAPAGSEGTPGAQGPPGLNGSDSTVPGPQGPQGAAGPAGPQGEPGVAGATGPAGPTCPDGYTPTLAWISVSESGIDIPQQKQAIVCLPTPNTPEGEPSS